jgi:hypothetical protein
MAAFASLLGSLGSAAGSAGSAIGSGASAAGSALGGAGSAIGTAAQGAGSGLLNMGQSMIGASGGPGAGGMGPPAPSTGMTGFGEGFLRGFTGGMAKQGSVGPMVDVGQFAGNTMLNEMTGGGGGGGGGFQRGSRVDEIAMLINLLNGRGQRRPMFRG